MPTYDFKCPTCGKKEEHFFKMSQIPNVICIDCFAKNKPSEMIKLFGAGTNVHFKGNGFYQTDYK